MHHGLRNSCLRILFLPFRGLPSRFRVAIKIARWQFNFSLIKSLLSLFTHDRADRAHAWNA
jgi:hypothetical protein